MQCVQFVDTLQQQPHNGNSLALNELNRGCESSQYYKQILGTISIVIQDAHHLFQESSMNYINFDKYD